VNPGLTALQSTPSHTKYNARNALIPPPRQKIAKKLPEKFANSKNSRNFATQNGKRAARTTKTMVL